MKSGIYRITCLINGKIYIGSAIDLNKRWIFHQSQLNRNIHGNKYLQRAWNKYGEKYFDFDIIEYCQIEELIEREQYYIDYMKPQFNVCKTAGSPLGLKRSEEIKKKMGLAQIGNKKCLGYKHTKETKKKMSIAKLRNTHATQYNYVRRKFPDEYIKDIKASKLSHRKLAIEYGCDIRKIWQIKNNKIYKDVK